MVRILHDDWSIRMGENRPDQSPQAMLVAEDESFHRALDALNLF